jgi:hypothetical protein
LPEPGRLFGCPLEVVQETFEAPSHWNRVAVPGSRLSLSLPPGWILDPQPGRFEAHAPDKTLRVSLRHGSRTPSDALSALRRSLEVAELGPSFTRESCAERVVTALKNEAPWTNLSFGYYGRPLGERRRRVALFAGSHQGALSVVVSTRWARDQAGPTWTRIWQILGSLRAAPLDRGEAIAMARPVRNH